jgi:hypothetical protein
MSEILDKTGKPMPPKAWEDMNSDEKHDALRQGIGYLINLTISVNQKLDKIVKEIDESKVEVTEVAEVPLESTPAETPIQEAGSGKQE